MTDAENGKPMQSSLGQMPEPLRHRLPRMPRQYPTPGQNMPSIDPFNMPMRQFSGSGYTMHGSSAEFDSHHTCRTNIFSAKSTRSAGHQIYALLMVSMNMVADACENGSTYVSGIFRSARRNRRAPTLEESGGAKKMPGSINAKRRVSSLGMLMLVLFVALVGGMGIYVALWWSRTGFHQPIHEEPNTMASLPPFEFDFDASIVDVDAEQATYDPLMLTLAAGVSGESRVAEPIGVIETTHYERPVHKHPDKEDASQKRSHSLHRMPSFKHPIPTTNPRLDRIAAAILIDQFPPGTKTHPKPSKYYKQLKHVIVSVEGDYGDDKDSSGAQTKSLNLSHALYALRVMHEKFDTIVDWFVLTREDTHVFLENLYHFLRNQKLDPSVPTYLGVSNRTYSRCANTSSNPGVGTVPLNFAVASLDAGIVLSRSAVESLVDRPNQIESCIKKYSGCDNGDEVLALCLYEFNIQLIQNKMFHTCPIQEIFWPINACLEPLSIPRVSNHFDTRFMQMQYAIALDLAGTVLKWDHRMNYGYIVSHLNSDLGLNSIVENTDRIGGEFKQLRLDSGAQCLKACKRDPKCLVWSYDTVNKVCTLKDSIHLLTRKTGIISGVVNAHYGCRETAYF